MGNDVYSTNNNSDTFQTEMSSSLFTYPVQGQPGQKSWHEGNPYSDHIREQILNAKKSGFGLRTVTFFDFYKFCGIQEVLQLVHVSHFEGNGGFHFWKWSNVAQNFALYPCDMDITGCLQVSFILQLPIVFNVSQNEILAGKLAAHNHNLDLKCKKLHFG